MSPLVRVIIFLFAMFLIMLIGSYTQRANAEEERELPYQRYDFGSPIPCDENQEEINELSCCKDYYICEGGLCARTKKSKT